MPTYTYCVVLPDGSEGEVFEIEQTMKEPALREHPVSGEPVRRVYTAPHLTLRYSTGATAARLSTDNVAKHGFTKYIRDKQTGTYHKIAGKEGPATLRRPD